MSNDGVDNSAHPNLAFDLEGARRRLLADFPLVDGHPDVAGLFRDPDLISLLGPALAFPYRDNPPTVILAPEARGHIVGALVARELGVGLVLVRKLDRNHPGADIEVVSDPTWCGTSETFRGRSFDVGADDRALIVDDWVTTGNSIRAVSQFAETCGAGVIGAAAIVNKSTPDTVAELAVHSLVDFEAITASR